MSKMGSKKGCVYIIKQSIDYCIGQIKETCIITAAGQIGLLKIPVCKVLIGGILLII